MQKLTPVNTNVFLDFLWIILSVIVVRQFVLTFTKPARTIQDFIISNKQLDISETFNGNVSDHDIESPRSTLVLKNGLAVMVLSARNNIGIRNTIRETWAKNHSNVFFIVGKPCDLPVKYRFKRTCLKNPALAPEISTVELENHLKREAVLTERLINESNLVIVDSVDEYMELATKLKFGYKWIVENTDAEFVLKADDDMYVRVDTFGEYLQDKYGLAKITSPLQLNSTQHLYMGWIRRLNVGQRIPDYLRARQYNETRTYPSFAVGSYGHVVSRPIAEYVGKNAEKLFDYLGEDTSLGIWLKESGFKHSVKHLDGTNVMTNKADCKNRRFMVIGHRLRPINLQQCFRFGDEF